MSDDEVVRYKRKLRPLASRLRKKHRFSSSDEQSENDVESKVIELESEDEQSESEDENDLDSENEKANAIALRSDSDSERSGSDDSDSDLDYPPSIVDLLEGLKNSLKQVKSSEESLDGQTWYDDLSTESKKLYSEKYNSIAKYSEPLPTVKDILDMEFDNLSKKELITYCYYLNQLDKMTPEYDRECDRFILKLKHIKEFTQQREQLHTIERNLISLTSREDDLKTRILLNTFPDHIKALIYEKYLIMQSVDDSDKEKYGYWIETALKIPQKPQAMIVPDSLNDLVKGIFESLNEKVYGLSQAKEEIVCLLLNMITMKKSKNKSFGLIGPPGVGKTMIARVIAERLNQPFKQISIGGTTDSAFLDGHGFTYTAAEPGIIVKSVNEMKSTTGIIFIDEIDKISRSERGKEVESTLLHITDFTQNHDFRDKFIPEIPVDLSNYIFIFSMNNVDEMDSALISRIPMISIDGYTKTEKKELLNKYLIPEIYANYNIPLNEVLISEESISHLIEIVHEQDSKNGKSGVRNLKNTLDRIIKRINMYRLASINGEMGIELSFKIKDFALPFTVTVDLIDQIITKTKTRIVPDGLYT